MFERVWNVLANVIFEESDPAVMNAILLFTINGQGRSARAVAAPPPREKKKSLNLNCCKPNKTVANLNKTDANLNLKSYAKT